MFTDDLDFKIDKKNTLITEINVTPMVDVMLVLLIIFMLVSSVSINGVDVNLPKINTKQIDSDVEPLVISINSKGEIFLQQTLIPKNLLYSKLSSIVLEGKDNSVFIRGDQNLSYGTVMEVISCLYKAGFSNLSLVSDVENSG